MTSEKMLFLALACTMLAALRLWERPTVPRAAVFAIAAVVLTTTHARAVVLADRLRDLVAARSPCAPGGRRWRVWPSRHRWAPSRSGPAGR
ncbi:hypothetical protein [Brachybacterium sp. GPGPB12]|uniref:hypothetical protein n=1 Tax=Brachybacterium sp. GPGPB12 TaxID=3023517 RepID=UPI0031342E3B